MYSTAAGLGGFQIARIDHTGHINLCFEVACAYKHAVEVLQILRPHDVTRMAWPHVNHDRLVIHLLGRSSGCSLDPVQDHVDVIAPVLIRPAVREKVRARPRQ